ARLTALINAASSCSADHAGHKPPNMSETTVKRATFIIGTSITHYASTDFHLPLGGEVCWPHDGPTRNSFCFKTWRSPFCPKLRVVLSRAWRRHRSPKSA